MNETTLLDARVKQLDDAAHARWDAFVDSCPEASFFHRAGWRRVIEESFGHRCHYLYVERRGTILGILPLTHLRSPLFGNSLISNAFCVYGGPATVDEKARAMLDIRACELAGQLGVNYLEYRSRARLHPDWACNDELYVSFRKTLDAEPEQNFLRIPRKQRAMVRKGMKLGLASELDDDTSRFFNIYATSVRNLGTPVFSRRYFQSIKKEFGAACEILTVCSDGHPVSSVMSFLDGGEVHPYYGGGTRDARALAANDFMYWEVMRRAAERGFKVFDFGRSKRGTGAFSFKKHWGFEPEPLRYEYKLFKTDEVPAVNPTNPKYRLFIKAWKRLPLPVANVLGPVLARQFG